MKNMKKIILSLAAVCFLLLPSCEKLEDLAILQEQPMKESVQGYMNNPEKAESVLFAAYFYLRYYNNFSRFYHTIAEAMTDYSWGYGSYAAASTFKLDPTLIGRINDIWSCMYRCIRFCNTIIKQLEDADFDATKRKQIIAEARFLRAFAYMHLAQLWGAVPLITDKNMDNQGEYNYPRTAQEKIFAQCKEDLIVATRDLPDTQSMIGRADKMVAWTVLTEVYLHLHDWDNALLAAQTVVNSHKYSLVEVSVSDDFYKLYHPSLVNTTEEIFYLKYVDGKPNGSAFAAMLHRDNIWFLGSNFYGIYSTWDNKRMFEWDDNDLRKAFNIYTVDDEEGNTLIYNKKYIQLDPAKVDGDTAGNDLPLYRYADLLMFYAEAAARAAGAPNADAMEKLNMVHRRAYGKPSGTADPTVDYKLADYPTLDSFIDLVLKERCYEDCYECKRYNDLKRCGKLAEYVLYAKGETIGESAYLWPIPEDEFLYNKGISPEDQNPGY